VRLLFERGRFDIYSTSRASLALVYLAPGLLAFSMVNILARAFYALGDTTTPMKVSVFCLALNAVLTFALIFPLRQGGLGVANTLSSVVNVCLLACALRKKIARIELTALIQQAPSMIGAAVVAGAAAWMTLFHYERWIGASNVVSKMGAVVLPALAAAVVYLVLCWQLKVPYMSDVLRVLQSLARRFRRA
jgi:putative peptidoglycan lipid II flippase